MGRYLELADKALEQLSRENRGSSAASTVKPGGVPGCPETERWHGQPHAVLFPYLGRKVRTPKGAGTLIQVFADRVTVLLECDLHRCVFFHPKEVEPACPE